MRRDLIDEAELVSQSRRFLALLRGTPVADGIALIRDVRRLGAEPDRVPALALTAYAGSDDERRALAPGYQTYLTKPIEAEDLVAAVARLAGRLGDS